MSTMLTGTEAAWVAASLLGAIAFLIMWALVLRAARQADPRVAAKFWNDLSK